MKLMGILNGTRQKEHKVCCGFIDHFVNSLRNIQHTKGGLHNVHAQEGRMRRNMACSQSVCVLCSMDDALLNSHSSYSSDN